MEKPGQFLAAINSQTLIVTRLDEHGVTTAATLYDPFNANPWSRTEQSYKEGKKTSETQFNDDDTRAEIIFNTDIGQISGIKNYAADGHIASQIQYDATNTQSWSRIETVYNTQGQQTQSTTFEDNGTRQVLSTDTANAHPWTSLNQTFNQANQLMGQQEVKDDGTREETTYDPTNANPWAQITRFSNASGLLTKEATVSDDSTRRELTYDGSGQITSNKTFNAYNDQIGVNGIIDTDIGGNPDVIDRYRRVPYNISWNKQAYHWIKKAPFMSFVVPEEQAKILDTIRELRLQFRQAHGISPVAFDLNHDGQIDLQPLGGVVSAKGLSPEFDWTTDGTPDKTAWVGKQDGLLVIDLAENGETGSDGVIDQPEEMVFAYWKTEEERVAELKEKGIDNNGRPITDLEGLRWAFDSNHDNVLDMRDARWNEFRVWQDANQNGITDAGELMTMDQAGIRLINLMPSSDGSKAFPDGSAITGTSSAEMTDGTKMLVGDVSLAFRPSLAG